MILLDFGFVLFGQHYIHQILLSSERRITSNWAGSLRRLEKVVSGYMSSASLNVVKKT